MMPDTPIEARLAAILQAAAVERRACRACGVELFFVPMAATGKLMPLEASGVNHWASCPRAADFRKRYQPPRHEAQPRHARPASTQEPLL